MYRYGAHINIKDTPSFSSSLRHVHALWGIPSFPLESAPPPRTLHGPFVRKILVIAVMRRAHASRVRNIAFIDEADPAVVVGLSPEIILQWRGKHEYVAYENNKKKKNDPCQSNPHTHTHTRSRAHWNTLSWTHKKSWIMDNARSCTDKVTHVVPHNQIDPLAKDYVVGTCVGKTRGRRDDHQRNCIHLRPTRVHEIRAESNDFMSRRVNHEKRKMKSNAPCRCRPRCTTQFPIRCWWIYVTCLMFEAPDMPHTVRPAPVKSFPRQTLKVTSESSVCMSKPKSSPALYRTLGAVRERERTEVASNSRVSLNM